MKQKLFSEHTDPIYGCDVYRDHSNGSCTHVDGFLCDFPECSILKDYRKKVIDVPSKVCDNVETT